MLSSVRTPQLLSFLVIAACVGQPDSFAGSTAQAAPPSACPSASDPASPLECDEDADCAAGFHCTTTWNSDVAWMVNQSPTDPHFGHCVDPTGRTTPDICWATNAIQNDIDALEAAMLAIPGHLVPLGLTYNFPTGARLRIRDEDSDDVALTITERLLVEGNGANLLPQNDDTAIRVDGGRADFTSIRDLKINAENQNSDHGGVGVDVRSNGVRLDNLFIVGMGYGVRAIDPGAGNVNSQRWSNLKISASHRRGVDIQGHDTNGGLYLGLDITSTIADSKPSCSTQADCNAAGLVCENGTCVGVALWDSASTLSTHVGHTIDSNDLGVHIDSGATSNRSTFVGVHVEQSDGALIEQRQPVILGGTLAEYSGDSASVIAHEGSRLEFTSPSNDGGTIHVRIPGLSKRGNGAMSFRYSPPSGVCDSSLAYNEFWLLRPEPSPTWDGMSPPTTEDLRRAWEFVYDDATSQEAALVMHSTVNALPPSCPVGIPVAYAENGVEYDSNDVCGYGTTFCGW